MSGIVTEVALAPFVSLAAITPMAGFASDRERNRAYWVLSAGALVGFGSWYFAKRDFGVKSTLGRLAMGLVGYTMAGAAVYAAGGVQKTFSDGSPRPLFGLGLPARIDPNRYSRTPARIDPNRYSRKPQGWSPF